MVSIAAYFRAFWLGENIVIGQHSLLQEPTLDACIAACDDYHRHFHFHRRDQGSHGKRSWSASSLLTGRHPLRSAMKRTDCRSQLTAQVMADRFGSRALPVYGRYPQFLHTVYLLLV